MAFSCFWNRRCAPGWQERCLVAIGCCVVAFVINGLARSNGIIYVTLIDTFDVNRKQAILPFVLRSVFRNFNGPLIGVFSYYLSLRTITTTGVFLITLANILCFFAYNITYVAVVLGVIQGTGIGMAMILMPVVIRQHFSKYKTTALGIALAGGTIGGLSIPPVVAFLIEEYGLRGGYLLIAGISLQGLVGASLMRKRRSDEDSKPDRCRERSRTDVTDVPNGTAVSPEDQAAGTSSTVKDKSYRDVESSRNDKHAQGTLLPASDDKVQNPQDTSKDSPFITFFTCTLRQKYRTAVSVFKNPSFLIMTISSTVFVGSFITFITVIVDFSIDRGVRQADGVFLISFFAAADFTGKLCCGWITDVGLLTHGQVFSINLLTVGTSLLMFPFIPGYPGLALATLFTGISVGMKLTLLPALAEEIVGLHRLPLALGLKNFFHGFTIVIVLHLAGYIRDTFGKYDHIFNVLGTLCIACGLLWSLHRPVMRYLREKRRKRSVDRRRDVETPRAGNDRRRYLETPRAEKG